jgi:acetamidase/formamidase
VSSETVRGHFNRDLPPVLTVDPGDTVICQTLDASWGYRGERDFGEPQQIKPEPEIDIGHAVTGPVAVRGAEPGDVLEVRIGELRPGHWGWTWAGPMRHRDRDYLRLDEEAAITWHLDRERGVATDTEGRGIEVPLHPFMGVMGNCPGASGNQHTAPPRRVGGNLDCKELRSGSTLWLPIEVAGALFSVGDGHGAQGDGEVGATGIECPMERVELTFGLRRDMALQAPRAETPAGVVTLGFGSDLDDAAEEALSGMLDYMSGRYPLTRAEAGVIASVAVDLHVTQIVNGTVGVHALLRRSAFTMPSRSQPRKST